MTPATDLIELYWGTIWNDRATHRLGEVFHDPYVHNRSEATIADHAAIIEDTVRSIPDVRVEIVDLEAVGDAVITRARFIGTHGGDLLGIPATGGPIVAPTLDVYFFRDGRVATLWHLTDHLPILHGMGAEAWVAGQRFELE